MDVDTVTVNKQTNMYVGRKRRKPVQKGLKQTPAEGVKSNPSKRHRERLNSELEHLARLLPFPEDVISSLDKLSILRLSVSFLRNKSFFSAWKKQLSSGTTKSSVQDDGDTMSAPDGGRIPEGELLMQALNGFVLVVTAEGIIFFCSSTMRDYLGFHQTDVMHQSVFDMIHTEDQQEFRRNLHWALDPRQGPGTHTEPSADSSESVSDETHSMVSYNPDHLPPENSSFLERNFVCRFRCLLDNNSGFLALNIQGRLKFLHGQNHQHCNCKDNCAPPQLALFAIATPLQPLTILEIRTRNLIFRTKHKLDFTPMACDAKGKIVLGYTEAELRVRGSGYQFIHAADMLHCAENHVRMMKTGESGLTVFRLLTKDNCWKWVQANARLVYKNGKPDYIIATQRPLADEEGGEHLRKRSMQLPFTFATGEALLYQTGFPLHGFPHSLQGRVKGGKSNKGKMDKSLKRDLDPKSLLGALMSQDESVYICQPNAEPEMPHQSSLTCQQPNEFVFSGSSESRHIASDRESGRFSSSTVNYDPLFESLSLDVGEMCSNSELFNALENLGLDAEDLELLLLDERMVHLELGSNFGDHLTDNNIYTYDHHSIKGQTEGEEPGSTGTFGLLGSSPNPNLASSVYLQAPTVLSKNKGPEDFLSQQMQHQLRTCDQMTHHVVQGNTLYHSESLSTNALPWVPKSAHQHPHTSLKVFQQNPELKRLPSHQWQLHTDQNFTQLQPSHQENCSTASPSQSFLGQTTSRSYTPNQLTPNTEVSRMGCSISETPHSSCSTGTALDICYSQHQGAQMNQQMMVQTHAGSSGVGQSSGVELEPLLDLTHLQNNLTSLQPYSMFGISAEETTQCTLENSCLLSATHTPSIKSCLIPNGNSWSTNTISVSRPEGPAAPQDP